MSSPTVWIAIQIKTSFVIRLFVCWLFVRKFYEIYVQISESLLMTKRTGKIVVILWRMTFWRFVSSKHSKNWRRVYSAEGPVMPKSILVEFPICVRRFMFMFKPLLTCPSFMPVIYVNLHISDVHTAQAHVHSATYLNSCTYCQMYVRPYAKCMNVDFINAYHVRFTWASACESMRE